MLECNIKFSIIIPIIYQNDWSVWFIKHLHILKSSTMSFVFIYKF